MAAASTDVYKISSVVSGHCTYINVWTSNIGETQQVVWKDIPMNIHSKHAVAIIK